MTSQGTLLCLLLRTFVPLLVHDVAEVGVAEAAGLPHVEGGHRGLAAHVESGRVRVAVNHVFASVYGN